MRSLTINSIFGLLCLALPAFGQDSVSPQEYFVDRIRMEAGQPAIGTIPELRHNARLADASHGKTCRRQVD